VKEVAERIVVVTTPLFVALLFGAFSTTCTLTTAAPTWSTSASKSGRPREAAAMAAGVAVTTPAVRNTLAPFALFAAFAVFAPFAPSASLAAAAPDCGEQAANKLTNTMAPNSLGLTCTCDIFLYSKPLGQAES